jgi:hypothetical protein
MSLKPRHLAKTRRGYREMSSRIIIGKVKRQNRKNNIKGRDDLVVLPVFDKTSFIGVANLEKSVVSTIKTRRISVHGIGIDAITLGVLPRGSFK